MAARSPAEATTRATSRTMTLDRLLAHTGGRGPGGAVVVDGDQRVTMAELDERGAALATALADHGVGRGDAVAWQLPNWHESLVCYLACWRLGSVAVPLHHRAGRSEVDHGLAAVGPAVVIAAPDLPAATEGAIHVRGDGAYEELITRKPRPLPRPEPDDRAVVLFTSGSTSEPKGVVHTHRSLAHKAHTMVDVHGLTPADVVLMPAPMAHVSGLLNGLLVPGAAGMNVALMDRWDADDALTLIEREHVSFMVGPPTFFHGLMDAPGFSPERVASLRIVSCGGTGVTPEFVRDASARLGATVKRSYGSTEAPTVTSSYAGDPPDRAATTDGRAVGDVELRVADPTTGAPLSPSTAGELWVRGTEVFAGYLDPAQTEAVFVDDWFRTGDLVTIDHDGWLTVVGRCKDVIIRGGENIAPGEVEAVLESHPSVRRAVAVGLPDERLGEVVAAVVVADDDLDLDACRRWFAERGVARFKAPERLARVDEIPLLASGKPDRRAIRALVADAP